MATSCASLQSESISGSSEEEETKDLIDLKIEALQRKLLGKRFTADEMSWLKALSPPPEGEEDESGDGDRVVVGPTPDLQTLITRHNNGSESTDRDQRLSEDDDEELIEGIIQVKDKKSDLSSGHCFCTP